jgi:hypothetical protein
MIIYGEASPENSAVPVRKKWVDLDKESPGSAQVLLELGLRVPAHGAFSRLGTRNDQGCSSTFSYRFASG